MMRAYSLNYQSAAQNHAGAHAQLGNSVYPHAPEIEALVIVKYSHDARLIREALNLAGIEHGLTVTTDGLEALSFVRKSGNFARMPRPDLIVLDLELDKVSGHVVLDAIRMDPDMRALPVVLLGGFPAQWNLSHNENLKSCRFVSKPIDRESLATELALLHVKHRQ